MNISWLRTLEKLESAGFIASSAVPSGIRADLERWGERSGCLALERHGRGCVLRVLRPAILESEIGKLRPHEDCSSLVNRAANLARFRDTKTGESRQDYSYMLAKAFGEAVVIQRAEKMIDLSAHSAMLGCFAIPLQDEPTIWQGDFPLMLVENQALFDHTGWLRPDWRGLLLYYQGNISERLLLWLHASRFPSVTLFPDYDGVGLGNFARLREALPTAQWHWEEGWENALSLYGNRSLWQKEEQRRQVDTLYAQWEQNGYPDPGLRELMRLMRKEGKMLEQEWVLIERAHPDGMRP